MVESLLQNADKLDNIWLIGFAMGTIIFQWWLIVHLYKENKKEYDNIVKINAEIIQESAKTIQFLKQIVDSNEKLNERIDLFFMKK